MQSFCSDNKSSSYKVFLYCPVLQRNQQPSFYIYVFPIPLMAQENLFAGHSLIREDVIPVSEAVPSLIPWPPTPWGLCLKQTLVCHHLYRFVPSLKIGLSIANLSPWGVALIGNPPDSFQV